jgi:transketolase
MARPADANETAVVWHEVLSRHAGPTGIALTRQNVPVLPRGGEFATAEQAAEGVRRGAYVLADSPTGSVDVLLIATGSEVQLAVEARERLAADGVGARVVSAPCLEWFAEQSEEYRESVLPATVPARVSVEAGLALGWERYVGDRGRSVSIEHFGASADYETLFREFGITTEAVVDAARESIAHVARSLGAGERSLAEVAR